MHLAGLFRDPYKPRYQRNNKRTGQKNLRCFPVCAEPKHVDGGFCGQGVTVQISGLEVPKDSSYVVRAFGEFVEAGSDSEFGINDKLSVRDAQDRERRRENPTLPWLRGEVSLVADRPDAVEVIFNRQLLGWHYEWRSSKHTCDAFHCFRANVFLHDASTDDLIYVGKVDGPRFQIYSRRRQRGIVDPAAAKSVGSLKRKRIKNLENLGSVGPAIKQFDQTDDIDSAVPPPPEAPKRQKGPSSTGVSA